ncbi:NADAR family protein [Ktedonobacteria bacterium brp13]|nr:NADAR family protein [Ktedonobacteria bacterium brp13]
MAIRFYMLHKPYGCFSNFSAYGFTLDDVWWMTSEHYFQAQKFFPSNTYYAEQIRRASSPREAANLGRQRTIPLRADWEQVKDAVMHRAVLCKFETHADIRAILLSTGDEEIIENAPNDAYWGCGPNGDGENKLGHILMHIRQTLRERR